MLEIFFPILFAIGFFIFYAIYKHCKTAHVDNMADKFERFARNNKLDFSRIISTGLLYDRDLKYSSKLGETINLKNVIKGKREDLSFYFGIFFYIFRTPKRGEDLDYMDFYSAITPNMDIPYFFMRKRIPIIDSIIKIFGVRFIEFKEDREFSSKFVLVSDLEESVREIFTPQVRKLFLKLSDKRYKFEGVGDILFVLGGNEKDLNKRAKTNDTIVRIVEEFAKNKIFGNIKNTL